jgi:hypothetical protein
MVVSRADQDDEDAGITNEFQEAVIAHAFQANGSDRTQIGAIGRNADRHDEN